MLNRRCIHGMHTDIIHTKADSAKTIEPKFINIKNMFANIFTRTSHRATITLIKLMFALRVDVVFSAWCGCITFFGNSIICKTISGLGTLPEGSRVTRLARGLTNVRTKSVVDLMHNAASGPPPATKRPAKTGTVCLRRP